MISKINSFILKKKMEITIACIFFCKLCNVTRIIYVHIYFY